RSGGRYRRTGRRAWPGRGSAASAVSPQRPRERWRGPFSAYIEDNVGVVSVTPQEFFCVNNGRGKAMRVDLLTKEYPPEVYGGAGVHVAELARALRARRDVRVRACGADREERGTSSYQAPGELAEANAALSSMGTGLLIAADCEGADLVHYRTWYANFAGHIASLLHGIPHVLS